MRSCAINTYYTIKIIPHTSILFKHLQYFLNEQHDDHSVIEKIVWYFTQIIVKLMFYSFTKEWHWQKIS